LLPHLPKAPKSLSSRSGCKESHKVSPSRGVNGMYHLHRGHGMFANGAYHWVMKCTNGSENSPAGRTGDSWVGLEQGTASEEHFLEGEQYNSDDKKEGGGSKPQSYLYTHRIGERKVQILLRTCYKNTEFRLMSITQWVKTCGKTLRGGEKRTMIATG